MVPDLNEYGDNDPKSPVTLARVILTNKIMEQLIEELGERLFTVRRLIEATQKETRKNDPHYGVYQSVLHILDQQIKTDLWHIGEDDE